MFPPSSLVVVAPKHVGECSELSPIAKRARTTAVHELDLIAARFGMLCGNMDPVMISRQRLAVPVPKRRAELQMTSRSPVYPNPVPGTIHMSSYSDLILVRACLTSAELQVLQGALSEPTCDV
eukprot:5581551-Amphidinium_carterae.1